MMMPMVMMMVIKQKKQMMSLLLLMKVLLHAARWLSLQCNRDASAQHADGAGNWHCKGTTGISRHYTGIR